MGLEHMDVMEDIDKALRTSLETYDVELISSLAFGATLHDFTYTGIINQIVRAIMYAAEIREEENGTKA